MFNRGGVFEYGTLNAKLLGVVLIGAFVWVYCNVMSWVFNHYIYFDCINTNHDAYQLKPTIKAQVRRKAISPNLQRKITGQA